MHPHTHDPSKMTPEEKAQYDAMHAPLVDYHGGGQGGGHHQVIQSSTLNAAGEALFAGVPDSDFITRVMIYTANSGRGLTPGLANITPGDMQWVLDRFGAWQIRWDNNKRSLVDKDGNPITLAQAKAIASVD